MNIKQKKKNFFSFFLSFFNFSVIWVIFFMFVIFTFILIYKLYDLQIKKGEIFNKEVEKKAQRVNNNLKNRGKIFFKNDDENKTSVALQKTGYILAIVPKNIKNSNEVFQKLSEVIFIEKEDFLKKANKKNDNYEIILQKINEEEKNKIKALKLSGVVLEKKLWRYYPYKNISSKIIGFTNIDMVGSYGLEKYYDDVLRRERLTDRKNFFFSFFKKDKSENEVSKKIIYREGDLISSVDIGLSSFVEKTLLKINENYNSKYSAAIITNPKTGEIIAMTDSENFDLNNQKKDYRNKFIEHRFEVGSSLKPLVLAIGLDSGQISKNFIYNDTGCVNILNKKICNFDKKSRGQNTNLQTIISQSLNTGMIEIEKKIGHKIFFKYLLNLGFSEETGIDLNGEITSDISNLYHPNDVNYATASFGQGIAFTPIAITKALSVLANDGFLVTPHLVKKIEYGGLIPDKKFLEKKKKIFSFSTVKLVKDIMVRRSDDFSKNKIYFNKHYAVASKTGTAQIASPEGGYYADKYIHTYFGFFPAYAKPEDRYFIFIYTIEPQGKRYASETLTKPFYDIVNFMISYFKIKPDRVEISI